jgi:hypothetical protein
MALFTTSNIIGRKGIYHIIKYSWHNVTWIKDGINIDRFINLNKIIFLICSPLLTSHSWRSEETTFFWSHSSDIMSWIFNDMINKYHHIRPMQYHCLTSGSSWSWSHGSWIYNYLCHQCLSPLTLWLRIPMLNRVRVMVFSTTFNNISVISWLSVLLVKETWVPKENHRPVASHWQTLLSHNIVLSTPRLSRIWTRSIYFSAHNYLYYFALKSLSFECYKCWLYSCFQKF